MKKYLENGQEVILDEVLTNEKGKTKYLVTPIFCGEAFRVSGAGGYHHEISVEYEHEAPQIIVDKIFEEAPTEKIDKKILDKEKELKQINASIGALALVITELKAKELKLNSEIKSNEFTIAQKEQLISLKNAEIENKENEIEELNNSLYEKKMKLKKIEEKVAYIAIKAVSLKDEPDLEISLKDEDYEYLQKRDFKLKCLENGGVDNWEWYGESLTEYFEKYGE